MSPDEQFTLTFYARASRSRPVEVLLQGDAPDFRVIWQQTAFLSEAWERFDYLITLPSDMQTTSPQLKINLAQSDGQVWLDDFSLCNGAVPPPTNTPLPGATPSNTPAPTPTPPATQPGCRITNGGFEKDTIAPWDFNVADPALATLTGDVGPRSAQAALINITRATANERDIALSQSGLTLPNNRAVFLDFYGRATTATQLSVHLTSIDGTILWQRQLRLPEAGPDRRYRHFFMPIEAPAAANARLSFYLGRATGGIAIDDVQLCDAPQQFRDDFSGNQLNTAVWEHCKAYLKDCAVEDANGSIEWWKPSNATVADGALQMAFTRDPATVCIDCTFRDIRYVQREYAGVYLQTSNTFTLTSGYMEARMKMPAASGLWPAFWLLPSLSPQGNIVWPPEIDVVEQFTRSPDETFHTLHYPSPEKNLQDGYTIRFPFNVADDYRVFATNWTPEGLIWYVDGVEVHRSSAYIIDMPMYLIISVGAGGPAGLPAADLSNASTYVDYVRIYDNARAFGAEIEPPIENTPVPTLDTSSFRRIYLPVAARR